MDDIYKPKGSLNLAEIPSISQIRLGLQGAPGCGKTWGALTFPNPIVLNFDRGLGAHNGRADVIEVPFYKAEFVDSIHKRDGLQCPPNRKDALVDWLVSEGLKLKPNQTLIIDSNTQVDVSYHTQYKLNPKVTNSGKIDDYAEWNQKVTYFGSLMDVFKQLPCHVVYISHETDDRDKTGELNGRVRPLLTGQFADQLASHFTDYFRCHAFNKPKDWGKFKDYFKDISDDVLKEWIASTPKECGSFYLWETVSNQFAKHCKTSSLINCPQYIIANYSSFLKYQRKQN